MDRGKKSLRRAIHALMLASVLALPCRSFPAQQEYDLIIEDYHSQKILWQQPLRQGEELIYRHIHSVYGLEVTHRYLADSRGRLFLASVKSSCWLLYSPYPGYSLVPTTEKADGQGTCEVKINRIHDPIILAVGDELTAKRFLLGGKLIQLNRLEPKASIVKVYLKQRKHSAASCGVSAGTDDLPKRASGYQTRDK